MLWSSWKPDRPKTESGLEAFSVRALISEANLCTFCTLYQEFRDGTGIPGIYFPCRTINSTEFLSFASVSMLSGLCHDLEPYRGAGFF